MRTNVNIPDEEVLKSIFDLEFMLMGMVGSILTKMVKLQLSEQVTAMYIVLLAVRFTEVHEPILSARQLSSELSSSGYWTVEEMNISKYEDSYLEPRDPPQHQQWSS